MARRLLGPDNASDMFDQDCLSDSQLDQVLQPDLSELFDCKREKPSEKIDI